MKKDRTSSLVNPDSVRSVDPQLLLRLLQGFESELRDAGLIGDAELDVLTAQHLIRSPVGLPDRLFDALALIDELNSDDMHMPAWRLCKEAKVPDASLECTTSDLVVLLSLNRPELLERLYAQRLLTTRRTFTFHQSNGTLKVPRTDSASIEALRADLEADFHLRSRGRFARVLPFEDHSELRLVIRRADVPHREAVVEPGHDGVSHIKFEPERFSIAVFDKNAQELRVQTKYDSDREALVRLIGNRLFGTEAAFNSRASNKFFDLSPILRRGRNIEGVAGVPQVEAVLLTAVKIESVHGVGNTERIRNPDGLFTTKDFDPADFGTDKFISGCTFRLKLRSGSSCVVCIDTRKGLSVSNAAVFALVLEWIRRQGFCNYRIKAVREQQLALLPAS